MSEAGSKRQLPQRSCVEPRSSQRCCPPYNSELSSSGQPFHSVLGFQENAGRSTRSVQATMFSPGCRFG